MKIPVPPIEIQIDVVDKLNFLHKMMDISNEKIEGFKKVNKFVLEEELKQVELTFIKLGDVCIFNEFKKHDTSYGKENGKYIFYTGGANNILYADNYDCDKLTIIINRTNGNGRCNIFIDNMFSCATQTILFRGKNNDIETKYIYYYLSSNINILEDGYIGANHKNISIEYVQQITIPIPYQSQQEIVQKLDQNDSLIKSLQQENNITKNIIKNNNNKPNNQTNKTTRKKTHII